MRIISMVAVMSLVLALAGVLQTKESEYELSSASLTAEEKALYHDLLEELASVYKSKGTLRLANRTEPFRLTDGCGFFFDPEWAKGAGGGVTFEKPSSARIVHRIDAAVISNLNIVLVDPDKSTNLCALSEIIFDSRHNHALVAYKFYNDGLFVFGGTHLFRKIEEKWKDADLMCADVKINMND
jgi:hypothetical protein